MTIKDVAKRIGVSSARVSRYCLRNPRIVARDRKGRYVINEDVVPVIALGCGGDIQGFPLEMLSEPSMREAFSLLRFQREARLMTLIQRTHKG